MKKKILICSLLVLFVLLTVTTAFAYNVETSTVAYAGSAGFTSSMRGINRCTQSIVGAIRERHKCWLTKNGNRCSIKQTVSTTVPKTYYMYPQETGTLRLRIENYYYYDQAKLFAKGTFTSSY